MKESKRETIVYEGLGFPVKLVNVPMKKRLGEWTLDINFNTLQVVVLDLLARKHGALTGSEVRFIIDYLGMSIREFAKLFGISHAAVLKWINEKVKMNPNTEICLRLYLFNYLRVSDKEFRKLYQKINPEEIAHSKREVLEIPARKIA